MGQLMYTDKKAIIKKKKKNHQLRGILSAASDSYIMNNYSQPFLMSGCLFIQKSWGFIIL